MRNRSRFRLFVAALFILGIIAYLGVTTYIWARQKHYIYRPDRIIAKTPADFGLEFEDVQIPVAGSSGDVQRIHAWFLPAQQPTGKFLLYLHGSALNIEANIVHAQRYRKLGLSVLLVSYRGYGKSDGTFPAEASLYDDAEAAFNYLIAQKNASAESIVIYGHSLGGAVAIHLALNHPDAAGLIVEATFTSIVDMANLNPKYKFLPIALIVNQRFESRKKVQRLQLPVLYLHGTLDSLVPPQMSRALYERTRAPKQIKLIPGGGHNNSAAVGGEHYLQAVRSFLEFAERN
jgi:pimeloyl-ACP methyl ester carboxylesterase